MHLILILVHDTATEHAMCFAGMQYLLYTKVSYFPLFMILVIVKETTDLVLI